MADEASPDGQRLIANWLKATEQVDLYKRELNRAECNEQNAHNELAKWMVPSDAKPGEKIAIWHGDSLFQVEVFGHGRDPKVTIRTRGRRFHELSRVA